MKKQLTKIGKTPFTISVPESIEEFDGAHKRAGAVLDKAINYDVAHTILGKIRAKAGEKLAEMGAERDVASTNPDGTKNLKPIDTKWIDRAFTALEMSATAQSEFYQAIADEIGYDVSGTRSSNAAFNQVDMKDAKAWLEAQKLGKTSFDRLKTNLEARNPGYELVLDENGEADLETIAAGLKVERARVEAERQNSIL